MEEDGEGAGGAGGAAEEALAREMSKKEASGKPPPHHSIAMFFDFLHIFPISITRISGDQPPATFPPSPITIAITRSRH